MCRRNVCLSLLLLLLSLCAFAQPDPRTEPGSVPETIHVGVLATRGSHVAMARWQPMMDWLSQHVAQTHFQLHPFTLDQMAAAVQTQQIDFIITNPGQAVQLGRQFPLSWLATLRSRHQGRSMDAIGSALVVRASSPYQQLSDLKGRRVAAVSDIAFGGYLTLKREIQLAGYDPAHFFSAIDFIGFPLDALIYRLRDGDVDGAIVPVCHLEEMVGEGLIPEDGFRVVDNQAPAGFSCQVSSRLYPNWSFAKTGNVSEAITRRISAALLALPEDHPASLAAGSLGWTAPISQLVIDRVYQDLDMHPLQRPWWQAAFAWLKANQQWGWLLLLLIVVLNVYHFVLEYRFTQNQRLLLQTQRELNEKIAMLEHAQRVAIVGELSAGITHELSQPLSAIQNYSQGALVRVNKGQPAAELRPVLQHIQHQVSRASDIVLRLRGLIKKRASSKAWHDIVAIVDDTLLLLKHALEKHAVSVTFTHEQQRRLLFLDPIGLQQLLFNLIKNGIDACGESGRQPALITIDLRFTDTDAVIRITDNGNGLADDPERLQRAFYSTKEDGLGLGLAICRDVVKRHHGRMTIANATPYGCMVELRFPLTIDPEQDNP